MLINGYKLSVVCANDSGNGIYGDIYTEVEECLREHPNTEILYGFHLEKDGVETPDWFDTAEEAVAWASCD